MNSVKQMLRYWDPERIIHRDEDLVILQGVQGPESYHYYVRLERADVELEFQMRPMHKELLVDKAVATLQKRLKEAVEEIQDDLVNAEPPPQQWRKRKK